MNNHANRKPQTANRVIFIVGPTAVGKTEYAIELAKKVNGEVISADSMQVYRGMDIGTSKPTGHQRKEIPHYLIDIIEPDEEYSCADFREKAEALIKDIIARKKTPIVVGGSGLYVRALIDGLFQGPGADWDLRERIYEEAKIYGNEYLYERLKTLDASAAAAIKPNDLRRIVRALEVCEKANAPITQLRKETHGIKDKYDVKIMGLLRERGELYKRIDARVDRMFDDDLLEETKKLLKKGKFSRTAAQALGYKEIIGHLNGEYSLDEAKRLTKRNTRHFAKAQLTWFRKDKTIEWVEL
ncbi:MAG: tRNA (adenosine(37)-N6)-dimethylallyltransferase MiaA [Candidatus Omnitrophota bacterium]